MNENVDPTKVEARPQVLPPAEPLALPPAPPPSPPARRKRRLWRWLFVLVLAVGAYFAWQHFEDIAPTPETAPKDGRSGGPPAQTIRDAEATKGDIPLTIDALGTVTSLATVTVRTQISGNLQQVGFTEGQIVKAGDFLAQIDPRPFQATLAQYQGQLAKDTALHAQAEADYARYQTLGKQDSIASQQVEDQKYLVAQYKGAMASDQAQIDAANLNISYCRIVAPISGRVGLRQIDQGNYVQVSDANGLVVITQLQPISVIFSTPEDNLPQISARLKSGATLPVTVFDRANVKQLATGSLTTTDNQIDTTTGTFKLRATFANDDNALFPNQFVNVRLLVDTLKDAVLVPNAAVQLGPNGNFVYVVKDDNTVTVRKVTIGPADSANTSIAAGLAVGDHVVIDGADRLREGAKVAVRNGPPVGAAGSGGGQDGQPGRQGGGHRHRQGQDPNGRRRPTRRNDDIERKASALNPSRIFIERPVATSLLMVAILLIGAVAYRFLPLSALPEVDYPTIQVQTFYPGASAEVMTSSITAPLERQFGQMPSLSQMSSQSSAGASVITLRFGLEISIDIAEQEVQAAINAAGNLLPADLPAPPIYAKVNPADAPILTLGVTSTTLKLIDVERIIESSVAAKLSQLPGVGLVSISGGQRPSVRIHANPLALAAYGLNLDDLRTTIGNLNVNTPKGNFDGPSQAFSINANDQIQNPNDYNNSVVAYRNGAPIKLLDVATVEQAPENNKLSAWMNDTPALIVNVQRQPGANVIAVVDSIKKLLPTIEASIPSSIKITPLTDRTTTIRASVEDVEFELALAVGLVVLVIFLFLRNVPATIIPSLSVPLSLVGTLAAMYELGFSLDNLSLMALTIATGFVVDDAIVMIENIARYLEMGETPFQAALKGSGEIGFTIISLTISLLAVLIPLLFMGDVVGRLFHEFAITLAVTIVISAVVSLTLVPMLCAKLLKPRRAGEHGSSEATGGRFFQALVRLYARSLRVVLNHQIPTLIVAVATFLLTGYLYVVIPKGFFPVQDTGVIQGITQAAQVTSFSAMAQRQQELGEAILGDPDVVSLSSFIGVDGSNITAEFRAVPHQSEAARPAKTLGQRDHPPPATRDGRRRRDRAFHAAGPGPLDRHQRQRDPVPVHAQQPGPDGAADLDAAAPRPSAENPRHRRCRQRSPAERPFRLFDDRPADRRAVRHHAGDDRQRALRRFRPAHHLDHLHAIEPVPRHPRRRSDDAAFGPVLGFDLSAFFRLDHGPGSALGHQQDRDPPSAVADLASEPAAGDDHLVQSCAGRLARRGRRGDPGGRARDQPSRELLDGVPGRGCGVPIRALQRGLPAASPPSPRCISCWACSTRASSIPSRSSRRFPRRESARC